MKIHFGAMSLRNARFLRVCFPILFIALLLSPALSTLPVGPLFAGGGSAVNVGPLLCIGPPVDGEPLLNEEPLSGIVGVKVTACHIHQGYTLELKLGSDVIATKYLQSGGSSTFFFDCGDYSYTGETVLKAQLIDLGKNVVAAESVTVEIRRATLTAEILSSALVTERSLSINLKTRSNDDSYAILVTDNLTRSQFGVFSLMLALDITKTIELASGTLSGSSSNGSVALTKKLKAQQSHAQALYVIAVVYDSDEGWRASNVVKVVP